jgi:hypothetical protein
MVSRGVLTLAAVRGSATIAILALAIAGCTERSLGLAETVEPVDDRPCGNERTCSGGTRGAFTQKGVCVSDGGKVELEALGAEATFCHCLHGCGPGIEARLAFRARNRGRGEVSIDWSRVVYQALATSWSAPLSIEDRADGCCSPGVRRDYRCQGDRAPWDRQIASGAVEDLVIEEHFDVSQIAPGRYRIDAELLVDGAVRDLSFGELDVAELPGCV